MGLNVDKTVNVFTLILYAKWLRLKAEPGVVISLMDDRAGNHSCGLS